MLYVLKLREGPKTPAMTITLSANSADALTANPTRPVTWKAHLQYDDSSRQTSAEFEAPGTTRLLALLTQALTALDTVY